jgi:hypothetical protein
MKVGEWVMLVLGHSMHTSPAPSHMQLASHQFMDTNRKGIHNSFELEEFYLSCIRNPVTFCIWMLCFFLCCRHRNATWILVTASMVRLYILLCTWPLWQLWIEVAATVHLRKVCLLQYPRQVLWILLTASLKSFILLRTSTPLTMACSCTIAFLDLQ